MTDGRRITILVDGQAFEVRGGVPLAIALLDLGQRALRRSPRLGAPRGLFCGLGSCFECLVTIDDKPDQRACLALTRTGMRVETAGAAA